jgi:surface polysaccharide O-acyltransferase-like enzyme
MQRDNSLDFIKGIAILSVIFLHNTPANKLFQIAWIGQAVPLFLLITAYLTYGSYSKNRTLKYYYTASSLKKLFNRICFPFLSVLIVQCVICFLFNKFSYQSVLVNGGIGPGCYYPWVYLQCWTVLPLIILLIDKFSIKQSFLILLSISVALELFLSIIHVHESVYRLLFCRYLFYIYTGCLIKKINVQLDIKLVLLAVVGLVFASMEIYTNIDFKPWFTNYWKGYHWPTAFYAVVVFLFLKKIYYSVEQYNTIQYNLS